MEPEEILEIAKEVVVALVKSELPVSVVEARTAARLALSWPPTLRREAMVVEPVTASVPVEVAPVVVSPPLKAMEVVVALPMKG